MTIQSIRGALRGFAFALLALGAGSAALAVQHWRLLAAYGPICGDMAQHCAACPAAVAFLTSGAILLVASAPTARPARARYV